MKKILIEHRKPRYAIESVDRALRVLHLLRDTGSLRIADVCAKLDITASTAHRIMAMLVYQGFAVQDESHRYLAGPALGAPVMMSKRTDALVRIAEPIIEQLAAQTDELINLSIRVGVHTRVLLTASSRSISDEDDRTGHVYPAHPSASGRALLALESPALIERLYRGRAAKFNGSELSDGDFRELTEELERTRRRGFAVSDEEVQRRVAAVAVPVVAATGDACTIVAIFPAERLRNLRGDTERIERLIDVQQQLVAALDANAPTASDHDAPGSTRALDAHERA